ncbi:discoidin domain-containing protein, partial [Streptomyces sp. NPDC039016]|uniref:discoidin domain-containing protein n=1 Tax=Streptomyces sp. NPDC039016 TaxID=3154330 RepID=UPI0033FA7CBC
ETYHLLYENTEIDVTKYSTLPVHDIRRNTMFYIRGRIQQGTGTAERTINTYITVNKPDLEIGNLTVNGAVIAKGNVTIAPGKQLAVPKIVGNGRHIEVGDSIQQTSGSISIGNGSLTVQGNATISGDLTATTVSARYTLNAGFPTASALYEGLAGYTAEKMLDGRDDTFYQSRFTPLVNDWAMVDLGVVRRITRIEIRFNARFLGRVETSNNQTNWTSRGDTTFPVYSHTLPNGGAEVRYIRVLVTLGQLFPFQISQFIVTPGAAFTVGSGPGGTLGTEYSTAPISANGTPLPTEPSDSA